MNRKRWLAVFGLVALGAIFVFNFGYVHQFIQLLGRVRWYVLGLIVIAQGFSYYCNAKYYQSFFNLFGYHISTRKLYEAALAINFVNQAFPSGGVSGASYLSRLFKDEVPAGKATLAQLVRYVFTFLSFLAVLTVGFILLFLSNNVSRVTVRLVLLFILMIIIVSLLLVTVVADRPRIEHIAEVMARLVNNLGSKLFKRRVVVVHIKLKRFFDEFYQGYHFLLEERGKWGKLLFYCLGGNIAEVVTVYVVFLAFGSFVNPGIVIVGYTLANIFSIVSIFSSGAGLYEATMVTALAALGVPFALSLSVVIVYRMANFAVFLPLGYYSYRKSL